MIYKAPYAGQNVIARLIFKGIQNYNLTSAFTTLCSKKINTKKQVAE